MDLLGVVIINAVLIAWLWLEICRLKDKIKDLSHCLLVIALKKQLGEKEKQNEGVEHE